jgi:hypothetical protein
MRGLSCLAENRLASQEGLYSVELVSKLPWPGPDVKDDLVHMDHSWEVH